MFLYMKFVLPWAQQSESTSEEAAPTAPASPQTPAPQNPAPAVPTTQPAAPVNPTTQPAKVEQTISALPAQVVNDDIVVKTGRFRVVFTNRGAAIKSVTLLEFNRYPPGGPEPGQGNLELLTEIQPGKLSLAMSAGKGTDKLDTVAWKHVPNVPVPEGYAAAVQFTTTSPERRLKFTKTFLFRQPVDGESGKAFVEDKAKEGDWLDGFVRGRHVELKIDVKNLSGVKTEFAYRLRSAAGIVPEPPYRKPEENPAPSLEQRASRDVEAVVGEQKKGDDADLETFAAGKESQRHDSVTKQLLYAGVKNRYFVAVVRPLAKSQLIAVHVDKIGENNVASTLELTTQEIPAGDTATRRFMFLVAPRMAGPLREYDAKYQFEALLDPGVLGPIKKVLTWLLSAFYSVIPNYGVAIILLTLCVRALLHPLTLKSQKAAHKMQKIQPLLKAAKEKYKHDKQLQQKETMKIMREQGANPLGGCLPMLLQFPIFIGLWRSLYENASLRHAPFFLWIEDLSKSDSLVMFTSDVLVLGKSFNLLPLLCATVMIVQHKLMPKSADPQAQQTQKMMMFMPILFAVMLYGMPSGLMIYFFCSSLFGLIEQQFIRRRLHAASAAELPFGPASVPVETKKQKRSPQKRKKRRRK